MLFPKYEFVIIKKLFQYTNYLIVYLDKTGHISRDFPSASSYYLLYLYIILLSIINSLFIYLFIFIFIIYITVYNDNFE